MKDWPDGQREAFWAYVRGRMAVLRLGHKEVAEALNLDRSVLTRRLSGRIKERPSEVMMDGLASALRLDTLGKRHLQQLAGYGGDGAAIEAVEPDHAGNGLRRGPGLMPRRLVIGAAALLLMLAVGAAAVISRLPGQAAVGAEPGAASVIGGGTVAGWVLFGGSGHRSSYAWVTIWYPDPSQGWRDRGVRLDDGANAPGCAEYLKLARLEVSTGTCYQFLDVPRTSKLQVRVHYESGLIRDHYFAFGGGEPIHWVGTTREE